MQEASEVLEFEKAMEYRDMIRSVEQTTEKQIIALNDYKDRDFLSFAYNDDDLAIHILNMRQGRILDFHQNIISYVGDSKDSFLLYVKSYYERVLFPDELIFDEQIDENTLNLHFGTKVTIPKKGDKKKMIDLCRKNAEEELTHYFKLFRSKVEKTQDAMDELSNVVGRKVNHIEVFDNAQLFGTAPISGMIVWKDHHFERKMYRKFHLKTTTNDDYQAMKEVVYRRYQRALIEQQKLPDLICVDGGKGQVSAALEVVDALSLNVPVLGLKKDQYHRLEGYVFNGEVHLLDKKGNLFQVLSKLSEEVHRFTITFHRETKNRKDYQSCRSDSGPGKPEENFTCNYTSLDEINMQVSKI